MIALFCDFYSVQYNSDDDERLFVLTGGPPSYASSVGTQPMPQQQTRPIYNPAFAAVSAPYASGYGGGDVMPPSKM